MYSRCFTVIVAALLTLTEAAIAASGVERWADAGLTVTDGLQLWLDAAQVNASRKAAVKEGELIELWPDASGRGRHARQPHNPAQPRLVRGGDYWLVRFDGEDDHFRVPGPKQPAAALTVFIVAAPHENPGDFRGFLAAHAPNGRDYETGFTIDLGPGGTARFEQLNVEGRGFGGWRNLLTSGQPFGTLHLIETAVRPETKAVRLFLDGKPAGERPFTPSPLHLDEIIVGARYYTNGPGAQQVRGYLSGDLAEILLYNRALSDAETKAVRQYLQTKYAKLRALPPSALLPARAGQPLVTVADPPPVQMLVPGFTVKRLPVDLTNINNVKYRADGKLVALAYNGNVFLLSDTDGDGLEDKAELFWEAKGRLRGPIGLALTPPGYAHGNGVFVPSKGKLSLIVDTDGDDRADKEIIVAQGWTDLLHSVDALGVVLDKDGTIYFGIGTANFADAYLHDKSGRAHYDLKSDRGTIQKVSPDFHKRETVCTGIRFPVALAFNRLGDLFCTDQEGATWLPNGNPFDELLHIQPGRHYGFPPRHPRHLPNVIDEPSVHDYGPQHQSTCGLNFNEPVNGGPTFGPRGWAGDALVCGESRGKLFRTQLVKTPAGYVACNHLFARLNMLTIDACVSPRGELVVTTHSGPPDWGTGPEGKGRLYKIVYSDPKSPQPVAAWAAGPQEVRVAFDPPLDPQRFRQLASRTKISYGDYVQAGDRFEVLHPPYAVVQMQQRTPRFELPVYSAQVTADGRTLVLATAPQRRAVRYAIELPDQGRPKPDAAKGELPQHLQIDLDYGLTGVQARLEPKSGGAAWTGWLPHLDLAAARAFTAGSAEHERLWDLLKAPGKLTLQTKLDLFDMLRPAVQVGAHIDHEWPAEDVTITFHADRPFDLQQRRADARNGHFEAQLTATPKKNDPIPVEIVIHSDGGVPALTLSYSTSEDSRLRAIQGRRFLLPWAEMGSKADEAVVAKEIPELKGGSWARGRKVFLSEPASCAKCHSVNGQGGAIGPDLSNLVHRDYASVLRDVTEPSFAINPDYVTYVATLKDGRVLTGALRTEGGRLLIGDEKGQVTAVSRTDVEELRSVPRSVMPEGLPKQLGPERMKDLLTFLLKEPPRMPQYAKDKPPPPRTRAQVQAILAGAPEPPLKTRPINVVLVAGKKDHGLGEHDYPAWQKVWAELLAADADARVFTAWEWPSAELIRTADVMVFYQHGTWNPERAKAIDAFLARGGGLVYVHWAVDGTPDVPGFAQRIGLASAGGKIRFRHGPLDIDFTRAGNHPITRNFRKVHFHDESYWKLTGDLDRIRVLGTGVEDGRPQPLFWTTEPGKGRVFVSILGHYAWTFDDPLFRVLLLRGIAWAAREPVDRFNSLVLPGARVAE